MFPVARRVPHSDAKLFDLNLAQASGLLFASQFPGATAGMALDLVESGGVTEDALQSSDGARRDARAACYGATAAAAPWLRRLARNDIGLHSFDVDHLQGVGEPGAEQRLDVRLDPTFIHGERRFLDRSITATEYAACLSLCEIPVAQVRHGRLLTGIFLGLGRVSPGRDHAELDHRLIARLLDRHHAEAAEIDSPLLVGSVSVIQHEGLEAGRKHAHPETSQFAVPQERLL